MGSSTDPKKRLKQHNGHIAGGAKSTRAGRPWKIATCFGPFAGKGEALQAEASLKKLKGSARFAWSGAPSVSC